MVSSGTARAARMPGWVGIKTTGNTAGISTAYLLLLLLLRHADVCPACRRTGSMFWPDLWYNAWVNDTIYTLVGDMKEAPWVNNKHHRLVDSGQMLFDRARHAEVRWVLVVGSACGVGRMVVWQGNRGWVHNKHHRWLTAARCSSTGPGMQRCAGACFGGACRVGRLCVRGGGACDKVGAL
jgi:hypothetical protein